MLNRILPLLFLTAYSLLAAAQTSISGVINSYQAVTYVDYCNNNVVAESSLGLSIGKKVLLIQMGGAELDLTETAAYGTVTDYKNAGNYEILTIAAISFNIITFTESMERYYDAATGRVQLVTIPEYDDVTIDGLVTAAEWNGAKGGIVAFIADGTVTFNDNIDVSNFGLKGGDDFSHTLCYGGVGDYAGYSCNESEYCGSRKGESVGAFLTDSLGRGAPANGGGGGNDSNTGGGGGANYGMGGTGGERFNTPASECPGSFAGLGGHALVYSNTDNKIFMGGGGGSGDQNDNDGTPGAPGAGLVLIRANTIIGNNFAIKANGKPVYALASKDGAGGGGGGGTILLDVPTVSSVLNIEVKGGDGGDVDNDFDATNCHGPGGGGGGGALWVSAAALPANIVFTGTPGLAGTTINPDAPASCNGSTNGAADGQPGGIVTGLVLPEPAVPFVPLTLTIDPSEDTVLCAGESLDVSSAATGTGLLTYSWNNGSADPSVTLTPENSFNYQLTVTDSRGCQITRSIFVEVIPEVIATAYPDSTIVQGTEVTLFTNLNPLFSYAWTPVDDNINDASSFSPIVGPLETTTYCVTVTDQGSGCVSSDCIVITVIPDISIPNVFSPNGDGVNDIFRIPNLGDLCNGISFFRIYTRWGQVVYDFALDPLALGWTGIDQKTNVPLPLDTYIYYIGLDCSDQERVFSSDVILLR